MQTEVISAGVSGAGFDMYLGLLRGWSSTYHRARSLLLSLGPSAVQRLARSRALAVTLGAVAPVGGLLVDATRKIRRAGLVSRGAYGMSARVRSCPAEEC
jgi:hypothetical protein